MKDRKSVIWGILLILLAAYVVVNRLELFPKLPIISILLTLVFIYFIIKGIMKRNFYEIFIPAALIGCMFDDEITDLIGYKFNSLTPWTLLFVALLLAIGFDMIFKRKKHFGVHYDDFHANYTEETSEDGHVRIESSFNGATRYVNSPCFETADIENNFGKTIVYFNNAVMKNGKARVKAENNFGQTVIYVPKTWRVNVVRDCSFGDVKIYGTGNNDMDAPFCEIIAEVAFGEIDIYFE